MGCIRLVVRRGFESIKDFSGFDASVIQDLKLNVLGIYVKVCLFCSGSGAWLEFKASGLGIRDLGFRF